MKKFVCTETGTVYTEEGLVTLFCESLKEDESMRETSFVDWMREATGKNGTLREFKPMPESYRKLLLDSTEMVAKGIHDMWIALSGVPEWSFNQYLSEGFPFERDWESAVFETLDWLDEVKAHVFDLECAN